MKEKVLFSWSSGKDSGLALHELKKDSCYEVVGLLTTVTEGYDRISMHGVRSGLLAQQAENMGMSLERVYIPKVSSNEKYETAMKEALLRYKDKGVSAIGFGDLFEALCYIISMGKSSRRKNTVDKEVWIDRSSSEGPKPLDTRRILRKRLVHIVLIAALGFLAYSNTFYSPSSLMKSPSLLIILSLKI